MAEVYVGQVSYQVGRSVKAATDETATAPGPTVVRQSEKFGVVARSLGTRTAIVVLTASAVLIPLYLVWVGRTIILLAFAGILVAVLLRAVSAWVEARLRVRPRWSLPLVVVGSALVLCLAVWLRGPAIGVQVDQLQERLPQAAKEFTARLGSEAWGRWLVDHGLGVDQLPNAMDLLPKVTGFLSTTVGFIGGVLIVLFLGVVIAAEPDTYRRGLKHFFPAASREYVDQVLDEIGQALRWWLVARLIAMCAVGAMAFLGLWLMRIPLAGSLGILAALLTFIPNVGPFLSAIPPVLLAFSKSPELALGVIALFCAIHVIEGTFITPIAERSAVHLPPALTLSVQMLLVVIAGPVGIAMAAPVTTVGMVLIRTVYAKKVLGE